MHSLTDLRENTPALGFLYLGKIRPECWQTVEVEEEPKLQHMMPSIRDMPTGGKIALLFIQGLGFIHKVLNYIFTVYSISLAGLPTLRRVAASCSASLAFCVCLIGISRSHLKITLYTLYSVLML